MTDRRKRELIFDLNSLFTIFIENVFKYLKKKIILNIFVDNLKDLKMKFKNLDIFGK